MDGKCVPFVNLNRAKDGGRDSTYQHLTLVSGGSREEEGVVVATRVLCLWAAAGPGDPVVLLPAANRGRRR
jgi:hypothetical protein